MKLLEQKKICTNLLSDLVEAKTKLGQSIYKKEKWEAKVDVTAAFDVQHLRNEQQRRAYAEDQRYLPGSEWYDLQAEVLARKVEVYRLEREYDLEFAILSALSRGLEV